MMLTIADRWRVTFRVQSLARVTMPPPPPAPVRPRTKPDLAAIVEARRLHAEMEEMRHNWETEALLTIRRMA